MAKELYSERAGALRKLSVEDFMLLIWRGVHAMRADGFFDESIGPRLVLGDSGPGRFDENDFIRIFKTSGIRATLTQSRARPPGYMLDDYALMFDVIEFLHDEATAQEKRNEFRARLNPDLGLFDPPMELLQNGQIVERAADELRPLLEDPLPEDVTLPIRRPFEAAIEQYRRRGATEDDKRGALKHMVDVLEPMKGEIKDYVLNADESALFDIANNFLVRHNNRRQKRGYDDEVWLDWMFYLYTATARAMIAVMDRDELRNRVMGEPPEDNGGLPL